MLDNSSDGKVIPVNRGDVMVIPAGISHCSSTASPDYRFIVLFPKVMHLALRTERELINIQRANRIGLVFGAIRERRVHWSIRSSASKSLCLATILYTAKEGFLSIHGGMCLLGQLRMIIEAQI